jgi:hypothetical protein
MTPTESQLVTDLFDRLAKLEGLARDPQAERAITDGLARAPNALYPLVQTALLQDQALKDADARIRELEAALGESPRAGGFLDSMRDAMFGRREESRASVPSVRPGLAPGGAPSQALPERPGSSFLGTAAASAAGFIGGALLLDGIRAMAAGRHAALYDSAEAGRLKGDSPWGGDAANSDLARQAGIDDIRSNESAAARDDETSFDIGDGEFDDAADFDIGGDSDFA